MVHALTSKGQVTIPKAIRDLLGLKPGDEVKFAVNDRGHVEIAKASKARQRKGSLDDLVGIAGPGPTTDEIMRMTRGDDWNKP